jgi:hypothetical protein
MIYSGSGIAIFEYYNNNKQNRKEDSVILFRERNGTYCLPGGKTKDSIKDSNSTIRTSKEETFEETCCLFNVSEDTISKAPFYDKVAGKTFYRCYAIKTKGILSSIYYQNRNIILDLYRSNHRQYRDYLETDEIVRVYIRDIPLNSDKLICPTAKDGKMIEINPRDSGCLQYFIRNGVHRHPPTTSKLTYNNNLYTYNI